MWHVGFKGMVSAAFLTDLAFKTRRGLQGRIEAGLSAGGISYAYRTVKPKGDQTEEDVRGQREIVEDEAAVVVRICENYRDGLSPKRIASNLNAEGVSSPSGGSWSQSTINGNRKRGTGILNNELYVGRLVWNRLRYVQDPDTGKRVSRLNPPSDKPPRELPHLRVISDELWVAVKARQARLDARSANVDKAPFHKQQRPHYLFSVLVKRGACQGGFSVISATHLGCSTARNKGDAVCSNRRTIKRADLEAKVLDALRTRLMSPDVYASFVRGFTAEWNKEQGARDTEQVGQRAELDRVTKKISNLVDAIAEDGSSGVVWAELKKQEVRKRELEAALTMAEAPAPRLMPNLAEMHRAEVRRVQEALNDDDAAVVRERVRALVEEIRLLPNPDDPDAPLQVEVRGALAALLALGTLGTKMRGPGTRNDASAVETLVSQMKLVAGAGFEPAAFRL